MFKDRSEAGKQLAEKLLKFADKDTMLLSIPRGGVPVGYEVAKKLKLKHDILVARKIGSPQNPEFGIGAITEINGLVLNKEVIDSLDVTDDELRKLISHEVKETERRISKYRPKGKFPAIKGKNVIVIDDGIATGITIESAIKSLRSKGASEILIATPVCSYDFAHKLQEENVPLICLLMPKDLEAVGQYYRYFDQVTDDEVIKLMQKH